MMLPFVRGATSVFAGRPTADRNTDDFAPTNLISEAAVLRIRMFALPLKPRSRCHGHLQYPDYGGFLRVAARLQAPVRRPQREARLPAGGGRPYQCGGLSRPHARERPEGPDRN